MEQYKPSSENIQPSDSLRQSPKILEYIERVKKGETIDSFGEIPESWKKEIEKSTTSEENKVLNQETIEDREVKIQELKKEIDELNGIVEHGEKINVQQDLKKYLLSKIETRFEKELSRKVARENIEKASDKELYLIALEQFYAETRVGAEYDRTNPLFNFDVDTITQDPNYLIKRVSDENGWHFRIPKTGTSANKSESRISLNVWGNKDLVERLDKIAYRYGIIYKTPSQSDMWNERNDPVTIYINNPNLSKEQIETLKQEVMEETRPYIRSNEGFGIYGDNIAPGIEFGPESSVSEIQRLKIAAQQISPDLYEAFDEYLKRDGKEKSSVGMNLAAQKVLNLFR